MARLSDEDLQIILGPDFAHKLKADREHAKAVTPEEKAAAARSEASKLADLRFTLAAVVFGGFALMAGSYFNKTGIDLQAQSGAAGVVFAVVGLFIINAKRRKLLTAAAAAEPAGA